MNNLRVFHFPKSKNKRNRFRKYKLTANIGKISPTAKFDNQLTTTATLVADGRAPWANISGRITQGTVPGPIPKNIIKM